MWEDPIVAEVHRTREALAAKLNFDVKKIFADIRNRQALLGSRLISQSQSAKDKSGIEQAPFHVPSSS